MNLWQGVLWAALAAAVAATLVQGVAIRLAVRHAADPTARGRDDGEGATRRGGWADALLRARLGSDRLEAWSRRGLWASTGLLGLAFLYLVTRFVVVDLSYEYVFLYTATHVPLTYRIPGAWTGREGSLLLWVLLIAATLAVLAQRHARRPPSDAAEARARAWTRLLAGLVLVAFTWVVVAQGTFRPTDPFFLAGRPGGTGLNPLLFHPYILIHPPLMFLAYALTTLVFAAGMAHLVTGTDRWSQVAGTTSRLDWVVYTIAMGLGSLWAYYTLGFGGYWAWDPVEVANLLPWLALTVYLHAQRSHFLHGRARTVGPFLALLPFVLTLFSTVSTRSGLWVSVHAFTDPLPAFEPDAALRALHIMAVDASLQPFVAIMLAALLAGLALWCRRLALDHGALPRASRIIAACLGAAAGFVLVAPEAFLGGLFHLGALVAGGRTGVGALALLLAGAVAAVLPGLWARDDGTAGGQRSQRRIPVHVRSLLGASTLVLGLGLVVVTLWHIASVRGWETAFWTARLPWLATPALLLLTVLLLHAQHGRGVALAVAAALLAAAVPAFLLAGAGAYLLVLTVGVVVAGVDKLRTVACTGPPAARVGSLLLWAAALLSVLFWVNPPTVLGVRMLWPVQVPMTALSLLALWGAHRVALGARPRFAWPYLLAGLLGGFAVAPVLAVAAFTLHRWRPVPARPVPLARLRVVGIYGIHLAIGLLLVGMATSTYFEAQERAELGAGDTLALGGAVLRFEGASTVQEPGTPWASDSRVHFLLHDAAGAARGSVDGHLYWEAQTGSHFPLPGTTRWWDRDVYVAIEAVCIDATGDCARDRDWVTAFEPAARIVHGTEFTRVRVAVDVLPGLGVVWGGLALLGSYGLLLVPGGPPPRPRRAPSGVAHAALPQDGPAAAASAGGAARTPTSDATTGTATAATPQPQPPDAATRPGRGGT